MNFDNVNAALITDDKVSALGVLAELNYDVSIELIIWDFIDYVDLSAFDIVIISLNLKRQNVARALSELLKNSKFTGDLILAVDKSSRAEMAQANALGAIQTIARPINGTQLSKTLLDITHIKKRPEKGSMEFAADTCVEIADMMDTMALAARNGAPLPLEEVYANCTNVITSMRHGSVEMWLKAVRAQSSHTYRHIMTVAGFAALFAVRFKMAKEDASKLTLGAMLHDIGKLHMPAKIIDKPGKLTSRETKIVREHPIKGAELMEKEGHFDDDVIMIVRNHHELLDGTGYPDGLRGSQIPDIVRIITVIDIFCSLIEARASKVPMTMDTAYKMLRSMGPKLDQTIVRAFEPIAYDNASHDILMKIKSRAA